MTSEVRGFSIITICSARAPSPTFDQKNMTMTLTLNDLKYFSYNRIYLQHVRKLQREMQNLKDWRNKQSDVSTETLADYETKFKNLEDRIAKQECPFQAQNPSDGPPRPESKRFPGLISYPLYSE